MEARVRPSTVRRSLGLDRGSGVAGPAGPGRSVCRGYHPGRALAEMGRAGAILAATDGQIIGAGVGDVARFGVIDRSIRSTTANPGRSPRRVRRSMVTHVHKLPEGAGMNLVPPPRRRRETRRTLPCAWTEARESSRWATRPSACVPLDSRGGMREIEDRRDIDIDSQLRGTGKRGSTPNPIGSAGRWSAATCGPSVAWSGVVYRSASPQYANQDDLLTGFGSRSAGARWNPPRGFPTAYASLDPHTALDEVLAHFRHYGLPIESAMPRVTVSVRVRLARVLDLTKGPTRSTLRVSARRMLDEPWREEQAAGREALTQAIGRLARELDWEGLLVPSAARTDGVNLVLFPDNLARGSALEIVNAGELPNRP